MQYCVLQLAIACVPVFKRQPHAGSAVLRLCQQRRIAELRLVDQLGVVAKNHVAQLGVLVQPHGFPDEGIKLFHQKIREVECGDFASLGMLCKLFVALKEGIAMGAGHHLHAQLVAFLLELSTGAAICIDNTDLVVGTAMFQNRAFNRNGDLIGVKMQFGGQAGEVDVIQPVDVGDGEDFARQGAAGDQQDTAVFLFRGSETLFCEGAFLERAPCGGAKCSPLG